jgi:hypothetical protein
LAVAEEVVVQTHQLIEREEAEAEREVKVLMVGQRHNREDSLALPHQLPMVERVRNLQ